jgi:predicted TIM-barrel fold metal-dependent hydrolase
MTQSGHSLNMNKSIYSRNKVICNLALVSLSIFVATVQAQDKLRYDGPIIDVHLHTISAAWSAEATPMNPVTGQPSMATTGDDLLPETLLQMDVHNIQIALLSGPLGSVQEWISAAPSRFVGGPQFPMTHKSDLDLVDYLPSLTEIRQMIQSGQIGVLGEITAQYAGMIPSDSTLDPYFALAEELDLPVGVHTGSGTIRILSAEDQERFRVDFGNPKWINDVLARYPRLRIYLMHAGYPFLDDTIALMGVYPSVYADLSRINWSFPRPAFHNYLKRLIDAGFANRLMFGTDGVGFPEALGLAVEGIESADFLTEQQKQNIFYNNAARFLRLSDDDIRRHHSGD